MEPGWFIDYLTVHQDHPEGGLPVVGKHGRITVDIATGEQISDTVTKKDHEGSYSSKVDIRCDGSRITVDGNPSRFNRMDNLWGYATFEECIHVYNSIIETYGLPPFRKCSSYEYLQGRDGTRVGVSTDGAFFTRVDWTRNWRVGEGREQSFLRGASTLTIGRGLRPHLHTDHNTVDWATESSRMAPKGKGFTYRYDKFYAKAAQLIKYRNKKRKKLSEEQVDHLDRVIDLCIREGIVREEQSKKAPFLKTRGNLSCYGLSKEEDFLPYLTDIETALKRMEVDYMTYESIAERLIEEGICTSPLAASTTESYALRWLYGRSLDKTKSQYRVHRSRLLNLGIDIAVPYDVSRLPPQIRSTETIELKLASVPDWYQMPAVISSKAA